MAEEKGSDPPQEKYPLITIRGLPYPAPFLIPSVVEAAMDFKPHDSDIFVVTYPKCGTTWVQYMVWEVLHKGAEPPSPNQIIFRDFPFLELRGIDVAEDLIPPRTMKTHLPFHLQPYNPKTRYIYVARNPWDCCVSYFYHHQIDPAMPHFTFDQYFEEFIQGQVGWGDIFDHVLSWYTHRNDPNVLFLTYEGMKEDRRRALLDIAKFLGEDHHRFLLDNEHVIRDCLKHSDFKYMRGLGYFFPMGTDEGLDCEGVKDVYKVLGSLNRASADPQKFKEVPFFRKGEVGDWRNHFSTTQVKKFNEYMTKKLKGTEMEGFWEPLNEAQACDNRCNEVKG